MIKCLTIVLCVLLFVACSHGKGADPGGSELRNETKEIQRPLDLKTEKKKLMETDRLFSQASEDRGFAVAFALFAAEEARIFQNNFLPIVGKEAIVTFLMEKVEGTITWTPYYVEVSSSGDLGYTLGKSQSYVPSASDKKSVSHGHYVTIWQKRPDGSWKVVFDTGIQTPK